MKQVRELGYCSAALALFFALAYSVAQLMSTFELIPHPQDLFWLFLPSLFLAPAFLLTMISLHYTADESVKIWTMIGYSFAALYTICACIVYFSQLTVVLPKELNGEVDERYVLIFEPKTFLMAVDCLGYFFMSLSTLFAAFAFREYKWLYRGMLWNGALLPVLILAFFYPVFYYVGALWMLTFPLAMINAMKYFVVGSNPKFSFKLEYDTK
ncbi:MAG: hypothetical protein JST19_17050 [Bacteroidetes bacterium]|nr:hypothetical protein [Bacteroidota bacterium]